ncbi:2dff131f-f102-43c3-a827-268923de8c73 [Thermothielavioides terrestris]|uniref:2dff131f-f102-43c3-a827-268923de8c73 n=1 Tax=Thermothielavioides terrestris TaxID=2587410 RepID=A0A446BR37_9PEZI|nr:2dff131f-f102-43c3-a827-268923de8c73 [Thermothielavioides terrestris]
MFLQRQYPAKTAKGFALSPRAK